MLALLKKVLKGGWVQEWHPCSAYSEEDLASVGPQPYMMGPEDSCYASSRNKTSCGSALSGSHLPEL